MSAPLPNNNDVWRIAAPMILSNISVPLVGMVDTGVTGHLESAVFLGAVAVGAAIFGVLFMGVNFLRMGTTGIAAQYYGAGDYDGLRVSLGQAFIVALAVATAMLLLQQPIGALAFHLLGAEWDVYIHAQNYFDIRIWSAPATLVNYTLIGWFIGLQNARVPLLIVLVINVTNIVLDLVFVMVLGMKVDGVAAASVIAEFAGLLVGLSFVAGQLRRHPGRWQMSKLTTIGEYRRFFSINANLFIRTMSLTFTFAFITAQGARLGSLVLAANAVLMNLQNLLSFALDGLAHAAEAIVGKFVGAKDKPGVERSVQLCLRWSVGIAAGFSAAYLLAGPLLIGLLTDLHDVREVTFRYLPWLILSPLVSVWSYLYDGVYVGATRAREMRDIMVVSTFLVFVPAWYALRFLGNDGLWLAFIFFMASRGIGMHWFYRRKVLPQMS